MLSFDLTLAHGDFQLAVAATLPANGVTGLIGPSGAGKSSLLRCLAGLEKQAQGRVGFAEQIWLDTSRGLRLATHRRRAALVFQRPSLFNHMNVKENLVFASRYATAPQLGVDAAIGMLEIGHLLNRHPGSLSGGEAQRVAIARALCANPALLLLDEPLVSVDAEGRQAILGRLEQLRTELPMPMLYVSHAQDEVARLSDHLMYMEGGRLRACGPAHELLTRLDLPLAHGRDAEVIIEGRVLGSEADHVISRVSTACGEFRVSQGMPAGQSVRLRIHARDVSLTLNRAEDSSILNILESTVESLDVDRPGQCLVRLQCGKRLLLARLSEYSMHRLNLQPGMRVYAQVKSIALA